MKQDRQNETKAGGRAHGESLIGVRILADGAGEECLE